MIGLLLINQDALGRMGTRFSVTLGPTAATGDDGGTGQGWRKDLEDGDVAVVLFNPSDRHAATAQFLSPRTCTASLPLHTTTHCLALPCTAVHCLALPATTHFPRTVHDSPTKLVFQLTDAGFAPDTRVHLTDLLSGADGLASSTGWIRGQYETPAAVPAHGSAALRLSFVPRYSAAAGEF